MCELIQELIDEEKNESREEGREEERKKNIMNFISASRELWLKTEDEIMEGLMFAFSLSEEEAQEYLLQS